VASRRPHVPSGGGGHRPTADPTGLGQLPPAVRRPATPAPPRPSPPRKDPRQGRMRNRPPTCSRPTRGGTSSWEPAKFLCQGGRPQKGRRRSGRSAFAAYTTHRRGMEGSGSRAGRLNYDPAELTFPLRQPTSAVVDIRTRTARSRLRRLMAVDFLFLLKRGQKHHSNRMIVDGKPPRRLRAGVSPRPSSRRDQATTRAATCSHVWWQIHWELLRPPPADGCGDPELGGPTRRSLCPAHPFGAKRMSGEV